MQRLWYLLAVLAAVLLASRLAEPPALRPAAGAAGSALAASPRSAPSGAAARSPAPRLRADARAFASALAGRLRTQGGHGSGPQPTAHAARTPLTGTRLALLEQGGPLRRVEAARRTSGVDHTRFELTKRGLPFLDRGGSIHERDGLLLGVSGRTSFPPLDPKPRALTPGEAIAAARAAAGVSLPMAPPRTRLGWVAHEGRSVLAWEVALPARAPLGDFRVWLDAADGAVLGLVDRLARFEDGVGVVYAENPLSSKTPSEQVLNELDGTGRLTGRITSVFDDQATEAFRPDLRFEFPLTDPRFVQTSVYRSLTETGLLAEQHGFEIDADVPAFTGLLDSFGGPLNNAFYVPSIPAFGFGNGDGTTLRNLGTDIDVAAHEYGHHVFELLVHPLAFSADDPVLAMSEGVADTFALLVGGDKRIAESVVPGEKALRTISNAAVYPDFFQSDPHLEGLVYAGANSDLLKKLGAGPFADLLIASLPFLPPDPIELDYRDAFLAGDQALSGGANEALVQQVFKKRGFDSLELPPQFAGELVEGVAQMRSLGPDDYDVWIFSELPPAGSVSFDTTGTGDVDLFVLPIDFDDTTPVMASAGPDSSESVLVSPFSAVSIEAADAWLVFVLDAPGAGGSSYTISATAMPRADDIAIDQSLSGFISDPQTEIDWYQFSGTAGQYARVAVTATGGPPIPDPLVAVLSYDPFEVLDVDDDSGGGASGLDALLQGVFLPSTGRYVIGVLSLASDFDPFVGTGSYQLSLSLCDNVGPDNDGDGVSDVCDQDDDNDGFVDAQDEDPFDPSVCIDVDGDGCNDCSSGSYDFRNDGLDTDHDVICDVGDDDDDNDGCTDGVDAFPLSPSADDDLDFLGLDCDNCAEVPNPGQEDADLDGTGDACSVCARVDWQEPPSVPPDQNPAEASFQLSLKNGLGTLRASGAFNPAGATAIDPSMSGVQLRVADAGGALLDLFVPGAGGGSACGSGDGWTVKGTRFSYANRSGALPPLCTPGSAQGLTSLEVSDERAGASAALFYRIAAKSVPIAQGLANPARFVQLDLAFGEPLSAGQPSAEGAAGVCSESVLRVGAQGTSCKVTQKDGVVSKLRCTGP